MIDKVSMLAEDVETIWNYSKYHLGDWVEMYTTDKIIMRRYIKFIEKHPEHCRLIKEDKYSMSFLVSAKCMGIYPRAPRKAPTLTEEQKQANIERLKNSR